MTTIQTDRLLLRPLAPEDEDGLFDILGDPQAMEFYPKVHTREETRSWIEKSMARFERDGHGFFTCWVKELNEFAGICGVLRQTDWGHGQDENEIGYLFRTKFWGQGFATEAAIACREWAHETFGYTRIVSFIRPENVRSAQVALRNGMTVEQTIPAEKCKHGLAHGVYVYRYPESHA